MGDLEGAVEGVILAAGLSFRAGQFKMTVPLGGKTVIERCVLGMYDVCARIVVVGGFRIDKLRWVLKNYSKVEVLYNPAYHESMFTSVKAGLAMAAGERIFVTPGDYPLIGPKVYQRMLELKAPVVVPLYDGKKGHPLLITREVALRLLVQTDYDRLDKFIDAIGFETVDVHDQGILIDLDTPQDYRRLIGRVAAMKMIKTMRLKWGDPDVG